MQLSRIKKKVQIGLIGSAGNEEYPFDKVKDKVYNLAYEAGRLIARKGAILVCGGKGGVMLSACKGAKEEKGITVGVISGNKRLRSNKYVDIEVVSGICNYSEDALIISMSDGVIALGGGAGTLQELALAYKNRKPIVVIKGSGGWSDKLSNKYIDERKKIKIKGFRNIFRGINYLFTKISKS